MPRASLVDYVEGFERLGEETALVERRGYRDVRWSYRGVAEAARRLARELEVRGVAPGERVLLWAENGAEWVTAFLGCLLRGAIAVPMDQVATADFACRVARQVAARLAICGRHPAKIELGVPTVRLEALSEAAARQPSTMYPSPALGRSDPLEIVFTSGTTAEPKGVVITHGNLLANLEPLEAQIAPYRRYERLVHPLRFLNLLPLSHVFGQFLGIFVPPLLAATVVFQNSLNPSETIRTIRRQRVSVLVAVPRLLETLRDKIERDYETAGRLESFHRQLAEAEGRHFLRRWWRFRGVHREFGWKFWAIITGGAGLPADVEEFWGRLGYAVIQGYGLTETTSLVSVNHPFQLGKGSIGKVLAGRELKLGEDGEVLVRGEAVAAGYWESGVRGPVAGEEGWFHTGDLGAWDEQGNLHFKGRRKNVIVTSAGMNIYPEDLEAALRRQPEVRDAVVIGLERDGAVQPCAVLLLRDATGGSAAAAAILRRANQGLAEFQHMRRWLVWPERDFPRTTTQKPQVPRIAATAKKLLADSAAGPATGAARSGAELERVIERITGRPPDTLSPEAHLGADLGLSSIDRVELLATLEDRYQIDLNEARFTAATTVAELEGALSRPGPSRSEYPYPRWAQRWPITWIRLGVYYLLAWPATLLLGYPRIRGRENLHGVRGPVLVVSNHAASIDIGFILAALPARFRNRLGVAMEGEYLAAMRHPPASAGFLRRAYQQLRYVLAAALFNVFSLPQQAGFRESFAYAGESVDRGFSVLVFPEGMRTRDGRMAPFQTGVGLLAGGLRLPIVPVRIDGLFALKQAKKWFTRPGAVRVTIGQPIEFEPGTEASVIARDLELRVGALAG